MLGLSPGLDLDEPALREIASLSGGQYFRARSADELQQIGQTLDQLEPVSQKATSARPTYGLHAWPLGIALLASMLLVALELWPDAWQRLRRRSA